VFNLGQWLSLWRQLFEVRTLEELAGYCAEEARRDEAVEFYHEVLDKDPLREEIHYQIMWREEGFVMKRLTAYMTPRNMRIAWLIITVIALAAAAGAPAAYGGGRGGG